MKGKHTWQLKEVGADASPISMNRQMEEQLILLKHALEIETVSDPFVFQIMTLYSFVIPSIMTTILYIYVAYVALKRLREINVPKSEDERYMKAQSKMTRVTAVVFGVYYLCYCPLIVISSMVPDETEWKVNLQTF